MPKQDCLFCQIVAGEKPAHKVYETDKTFAFLDIYPQTKGHTLIIPKAHSKNLLNIKPEDLAAVNETARKLAPQYMETLKADGFILKSHHNEIAGQVVDHFHLHLIPKYKDSSKEKASSSQEELKAVAKSITSHLT